MPIRFVLTLLAGLALLTWAGSVVVQKTTRDWFERDVRLRAELVVNGARQTLLAHWRKSESRELRNLLVEITHDERILAATACRPDLSLLAATPEFPPAFSCRKIALQASSEKNPSPLSMSPWHTIAALPAGSVLVSAVPVIDDGKTLGFVILVHDMSFVERRESATRNFLLLAFGILGLSAAVITLVAARLYWNNWNKKLRLQLKGETSERSEFNPILRDLRELYDRILEQEGGSWTPERLRNTLQRHLQGERIVILANREPYIHEHAPDHKILVRHPASGLVTALEPVMRACSGVWVAHGSGSADRETVDNQAHIRVPPGAESYTLRRVWLSKEEERGYYYGFANEGLWPLCHLAHARPIFRSEDWEHYQNVNRKFADAVCEEVDTEDPIILVQDYHFALVPRLIRERLPRAMVITFWHIPWPNAEHFGICPWRDEILDGLLGSSILGFHTQFHCNNFIYSVDRYLESRIDREHNAVVRSGRGTLVRAYPISVEWPPHWLQDLPPVVDCRTSIRAELGLKPDVQLGIGVDRLDYTKGIEERLLAVERLFEQRADLHGRFTFIQIAAPSRVEIERYRALNEATTLLTDRINKRFGRGDWRPIVLLREHHEQNSIFRYYRAADVCYVSSLHDGMNLVAKEFIASRDDEQGVLVLSQFTGAARELTEALIVNPYDLDQASAALAAALTMSSDEQRARMSAMRAFVADFNVYRWAGRMLAEAARLRQRDRLTGRLN